MTPRIVLFIAAALVLAAVPGRAQDTVAYHLGLGMSVEPALFGQTVYISTPGGALCVCPEFRRFAPLFPPPCPSTECI